MADRAEVCVHLRRLLSCKPATSVLVNVGALCEDNVADEWNRCEPYQEQYCQPVNFVRRDFSFASGIFHVIIDPKNVPYCGFNALLVVRQQIRDQEAKHAGSQC